MRNPFQHLKLSHSTSLVDGCDLLSHFCQHHTNHNIVAVCSMEYPIPRCPRRLFVTWQVNGRLLVSAPASGSKPVHTQHCCQLGTCLQADTCQHLTRGLTLQDLKCLTQKQKAACAISRQLFPVSHQPKPPSGLPKCSVVALISSTSLPPASIT